MFPEVFDNYKCKDLKSTRMSACEFTQTLIPCFYVGIYINFESQVTVEAHGPLVYFLMELWAILFDKLTFPLEHNNLSIYQRIFTKFCMQAYIHKISNEFEKQIASIIFNGVIALFVLLS